MVKLESVQNEITRRRLGQVGLCYKERLNTLALFSEEPRRQRGCKTMKAIDKVDGQCFSSPYGKV